MGLPLPFLILKKNIVKWQFVSCGYWLRYMNQRPLHCVKHHTVQSSCTVPHSRSSILVCLAVCLGACSSWVTESIHKISLQLFPLPSHSFCDNVQNALRITHFNLLLYRMHLFCFPAFTFRRRYDLLRLLYITC